MLKGYVGLVLLSQKEDGIMCDALRELMQPELNEAIQQNTKNTIIKSLHAGNSAEDIARIMQIPLEDVNAIKKEIMA